MSAAGKRNRVDILLQYHRTFEYKKSKKKTGGDLETRIEPYQR